MAFFRKWPWRLHGDHFVAHRAELQLRCLPRTAVTFSVSTLFLQAPFLAVILASGNGMPDAGIALLGGWFAALAFAVTPFATPWSKRRPLWVLHSLWAASLSAVLSVPLASYFMCRCHCDSGSRRCFGGDSDTGVLAAHLSLLSLSTLPCMLFRLPLMHAASPALLGVLLECLVLGMCPHGLPTTLVAMLLSFSTVCMLSVSAFAWRQREALDRLQFDVLCDIIGGEKDLASKLLKRLHLAMSHRVLLQHDGQATGTDGLAVTEIRRLLTSSTTPSKGDGHLLHDVQQTVAMLETKSTRYSTEAVEGGSAAEGEAHLDRQTTSWLISALPVDTQERIAARNRTGGSPKMHRASRGHRSLGLWSGAAGGRAERRSKRHNDSPDKKVGFSATTEEEQDTSSAHGAAVVEQVVRSLADDARTLASEALGAWGADVIEIDRRSNGHSLLLLGELLFEHHGLIEVFSIDRPTLRVFLHALESGYGSNPYHNSIHGADVMLSTHLALTKLKLVERLTPLQLLSSLLAAIIHDFNHPVRSRALAHHTEAA